VEFGKTTALKPNMLFGRQHGALWQHKANLPAFTRKTGISSASWHRMEMGEQNVTLKTLQHILKRFKCGVSDIFDERNS